LDLLAASLLLGVGGIGGDGRRGGIGGGSVNGGGTCCSLDRASI
jgi:hypothetical protein